jgi:hypothetical protein
MSQVKKLVQSKNLGETLSVYHELRLVLGK